MPMRQVELEGSHGMNPPELSPSTENETSGSDADENGDEEDESGDCDTIEVDPDDHDV